MKRIVRLYSTTLGKKVVVAVTGVLLFGFVLAHMAGNLKVFMGNDAEGMPKVDVYAHFLRTVGDPVFGHGELLWVFRIVLLAALFVHVVGVVQLTVANRCARPVRYERSRYEAATLSARWMLVTGLLLLAFIGFHILHFTSGTVDPARFTTGAIYDNLYRAFVQWYYVGLYVVAMILLSLHVYHGVWSLFQTLGLDNPDRNRALRLLAATAAVVLLVGFSSVPVLIFFGVMSETPAASSALIGDR